MELMTWERRPKLRKPALICAFKGWNDAAESATSALEFVGEGWGASRCATIDPEEFYDFQVTRPTVRLTDGRTREIIWPELVLFEAKIDAAGRDALLFTGVEPNLRWRTLCNTVISVASDLGVDMVVSLGALLADVPHTRPVRITGIAGDPELVDRLGFSQTRYEGPTGIVGVLHDAFSSIGVPTASLWASVPHYVAQTPSPKATLALVQRAASLLGAPVQTTDLEIAAASYERQVSEVVESDEDVADYVRRLEEADDDEATDVRLEMLSGDALAAEVEDFLRDQS